MAGSPYGSGQPPFLYNNFSAGLNTLQAPYLLDQADALYCRDVLNVQGTTAGAIVKRPGFATFASPANVFTGLFPSEATASEFLIGADSSAIYSVSSGGTVTSLKTGLSNVRWEGISGPVVSAQGPVFMMNGTDTPQQWNGTAGSTSNWTATDAGGTVPNGKYLIFYQNQAIVSGVSSNPSRVYWSGIADPTAWNPANLNGSGFMDFDPNDGAAITGIGVAGPYILVGKPRKTWVITSIPNATARLLSNTVGIAAHRSIANGPEGTFFLGEDRGVYATNGSKLQVISDTIRPTLDSIVSGQRPNAAGVVFDGHYYLSVALNGSSNDTILDYDSILKSWWKHGQGSNQFAVWHPSGSGTQASLYSAKSSSAVVDQAFVPGLMTDNGQAMSWVWRGPWQSPTFYRRRRFPTPYFRKHLKQVRFDGAGTVDFSIAKDFAIFETLVASNTLTQSGETIWGNADGSVWGPSDDSIWGPPTATRAKYFSLGVANAFSVVFGATSTTSDQVYEYVLIVVDRKDLI